jgi:predicted RNase H-like HicB family nuclease
MGATVDEALAAAEVALADFAKLMEENGETIPTPSAIEDVELEAGEMVTYVPLSAPAHAP